MSFPHALSGNLEVVRVLDPRLKHSGMTARFLFRVFSISCMTLVFLQRPAMAQENVGGGWPVPQAEQKGSKAPAVEMISSGPVSVRMDPSVFGARVPYLPEAQRAVSLPFPVSMPVAILYPEKAVRRGWEGRTVIAAEIRPDGAVGQTALAQTSGHDVLDNAARESIKTWKFRPASGDEDAVSQYVDIPVTFQLQDEE